MGEQQSHTYLERGEKEKKRGVEYGNIEAKFKRIILLKLIIVLGWDRLNLTKISNLFLPRLLVKEKIKYTLAKIQNCM